MSDDRRVDAIFAALSDATRREVLRSLSEVGPSTSTELAARLPVSRQAVAKHLELLASAGLVRASAEGRARRFRVTPGPMADAMGWMVDVGAQWDERLEALRRHVERAT
jgi:DNA-binding transcriptional ArsR family regulator